MYSVKHKVNNVSAIYINVIISEHEFAKSSSVNSITYVHTITAAIKS